MQITQLIDQSRGLDTGAIAAAFADVDQDEVTRTLVEAFAERTAAERLPSVPFAVKHLMYGDADVSEWAIVYDQQGHAVVPAEDDRASSAEAIRWEHWEDAVRLLNGDVAALSLLYSRRVLVDGLDFDEPNAAEPAWFRAVEFAPSASVAEHAKVLSGLAAAHANGGKERSRYVDEVGLDRIITARAYVVGQTLIDAGSVPELEGSFMRLVVPGDNPVGAEVTFAPTTGQPSVRTLGPGEHDNEDYEQGITLRYASPQSIVAVASGEKTFEQLVVGGEVKIDGAPARLDRFARALTKLADLYGG